MCILILPALLCVLMHAKSYVFAAARGVCALQALVMICVRMPTHWVSAQDNEKKKGVMRDYIVIMQIK